MAEPVGFTSGAAFGDDFSNPLKTGCFGEIGAWTPARPSRAVVVFSHYPSDPRPRRATDILVRLGMELEVISIKQSNDEPRRETFNGGSILRVPLKRQRGGKFRARVHDVYHSAILQGRKIPKEIGASTAASWLSDNTRIPPAGVEHGRNVVSILERAPAPVTLDRPD